MPAGGVVLGHARVLARRIRRALPTRLGDTVWFYVAAVTALVAGMGLGLLLGGGVAGSADAYRAMRLAHAHLNVLGWIGLAVVGTLFTLWPTVLRTRMVPGLDRAVRWALLPLVGGLAVVTAGLSPSTGGRAGGAGRLRRRARRRPGPVRPHGAAAAAAHGGVLDAGGRHGLVHGRGRGRPGRPGRQPGVVDLDGRLARLVPVVAAGFALQMLTGALTYLLPVVCGRGAWGNRRLTGILELGWPLRVAAVNLGVLALVAGACRRGWVGG